MIETLHSALEASIGHPVLQATVLFLGTFVLEEAALMAGALLAAAGELRAWFAAAVLFAGIAISDWCLYALGVASTRWKVVRDRVDGPLLRRGSQMLSGNLAIALLTARLVPWLLFPILTSCGVFRVGFFRFAAINLIVAGIYTVVVFSALYWLDQLIFDYLSTWGWLVAALMVVAVVVVTRRRAARLCREAALEQENLEQPTPGHTSIY